MLPIQAARHWRNFCGRYMTPQFPGCQPKELAAQVGGKVGEEIGEIREIWEIGEVGRIPTRT